MCDVKRDYLICLLESINVYVPYLALNPGESHLPSPIIRSAFTWEISRDIELSWEIVNTLFIVGKIKLFYMLLNCVFPMYFILATANASFTRM